LTPTKKSIKGKIWKLDFIKIKKKKIALQKTLLRGQKNTSYRTGEKSLYTIYLIKDYYLEYIKNSQNSMINEQTNKKTESNWKMVSLLKIRFTKEDIHIANRHVNIWSAS
jgi:hypothetical protein